MIRDKVKITPHTGDGGGHVVTVRIQVDDVTKELVDGDEAMAQRFAAKTVDRVAERLVEEIRKLLLPEVTP